MLARYGWPILVIAFFTVLTTNSCIRKDGTSVTAVPNDELPAATRLIVGFSVTKDGKRIRKVSPGDVVTVRAIVTDDKKIDYNWKLKIGAGKLQKRTPDTVVWASGNEPMRRALTVTVSDAAGATDRATLDLDDSGFLFTGQIVDKDNKPVAMANVSVDGEESVTNKDGRYILRSKGESPDRFILNVEEAGFGFLSIVYPKPVVGDQITRERGATYTVDPSQTINVFSRLSGTDCVSSFSARTDWNAFVEERKPRTSDGSGTVLSSITPQVSSALNIIESGLPCDSSFQVTIPGSSLVDSNGKAITDKVDVTIATVNLNNPQAMFGDYSVRTTAGFGYMEAFGAGTISLTSNEKEVFLKKGATARIEFSANLRSQKARREELPDVVPLLSYDRKDGYWVPIGEAKLDPKSLTYVGAVSHFSEFNADLVKTDPSCVRIDATALASDFRLEVTIPSPGGSVSSSRDYFIANVSEKIHALYNLPNDTDIILRPYVQDPSGTETPLSTVIADTGPPKSAPTVNQPTPPDYPECNGSAVLLATGGVTVPSNPVDDLSVSYPDLKSAILRWTAPTSADHLIVSRAVTSGGPIVFEPFDVLPPNANRYFLDELEPCKSWLYRIDAAGTSFSFLGSTASVRTDVTAFVTVSGPQPPYSAGIYEINCPGFSGGKGAFISDENGNGVVDAVPSYIGLLPGSTNLLYPVELVSNFPNITNERGALFGSTTSGALLNLLGVFRFEGGFAGESQYASVYLNEGGGVIGLFGMFSGNVPPSLNYMIVAHDPTTALPIDWAMNGYLPEASGAPGYAWGHFNGQLSGTDPGTSVIYQANVVVEFNAPWVFD